MMEDYLLKDGFILFWNGPFSQWYPSDFQVSGTWYNCVIQYRFSQKAIMFNDLNMYDRIMESSHPSQQKKLGRRVKRFVPAQWNAMSRKIVYDGNYAKFTQVERLTKLMLEMDGIFVEASPYDKVWGIGLDIHDPRTTIPDQWKGTNWLGEVLTEVRDAIKLSHTLHFPTSIKET